MILRFFRKSLQLIFAVTISLVILSVFASFYNYSGIHIENPTGATDYKWQSWQRKATMTEGFSWLKMDGSGFNNADFGDSGSKQLDILLMGSSHMEAVEVASDENTGYLLNKLAPNYRTYNIGVSGHTIYTCVNNMQSAVKEYTPNQYVILETSTVELDVEKMLQVIDGEYTHTQSYDSGILYLLQKYIPATKNIYKAIDEWRGSTVDDDTKEDTGTTLNKSNVQALYYNTLISFLQKAYSDSNGKLVIFYQPNTQIDETGSLADNNDREYRDLFASACDTVGINYIDMTDDFRNLYEDEHILAHGFTNTAVGVGHLNKYGHQVIAERLVNELNLTED